MIEIKNVSQSYIKGKNVIENMNLKIEDGVIFGFLGANGAGKTTTIDMITGIVKIDKGDILIDGESIIKNPIEAKSRFGFVPDAPETFEKLIVLALIMLNVVLSLTGGQVSIFKLFDEQILITENGIANEITNGFKLIRPIMEALQNYNTIYGLKSFAIYIIESIMIYIVAILFISPIYLKGCIGTIVNSNKNKSQRNVELKIEDFKRKSYKKAYLNKELKTIKRTPIFFIQCIIMPLTISIFILVVAVIFIFTANYIPYNLNFIADTSWIAGGVFATIQIFYMLNFSSIIAISKEEKSAIISKYLPIKFSEQLKLKMIIGQIINLITGIGISALYYAFTNNIIYRIVILIISIIISLITEKIKILIDLKNPRIKWDSEYTMMKQNTNVMYELFYTMAFILLFIVLGIIIQNIKLYFEIVGIITFIVNIRIGQYLKNNDSKIFERLY